MKWEILSADMTTIMFNLSAIEQNNNYITSVNKTGFDEKTKTEFEGTMNNEEETQRPEKTEKCKI
jgi:hypothetical protein